MSSRQQRMLPSSRMMNQPRRRCRWPSKSSSILVCALALLVLIVVVPSSIQQASGFSTPRRVATKTQVSNVAAQSHHLAAGFNCPVGVEGEQRKAISRRSNNNIRSRGYCLCLLAAASDEDDEEEKEPNEEEFETEATTTGLFIPGFSDKFAPPPEPASAGGNDVIAKEPSKPNNGRTPTITISNNPFASSKASTSTVDIPPPLPTEKSPLSPSPAKDLSEDVSRSVIELPSLPSLPKLSLPPLLLFGRDEKKKPAPPSKPPPPPPPPRSKAEDAIASAVGGALAGALAGLYADVATDILMDTDLPPLIPPAALGVALGAGAFVGANQENFIGQACRFVFGRPVLGVRNKITNKITETVEDIKATPGKIKDAAVQKVEDVVDEIKATPGKIVDETSRLVDEAVEEIKATPGRIAESIEEAIEEVVEEVVDAIEEVIAIPGKKLEEIGISLPKYDIDLAVKTPTPPLKTVPPPPPVDPKPSLFPPAGQKLELPSFSFSAIIDEPKTTPPPKQTSPAVLPTPQFPAVELPKIALPKVTIPELPKPTVSAPPKVVTPKQPVQKEEKKDNYMFTEAALKEFIQKDKPMITELDKQQEEERRAREAKNAEISRAAEAAFKGKTALKEQVKPVTTFKPVTTIQPVTTVKSIPKETPIAVPPVKGRPTFSLFGFGSGAPNTKSVTTTATTAFPKPTPTGTVSKMTGAAPRGVPTISKWKVNPGDNSISGVISGSSAFKDGEPVTTSAVVGQVASNTVVKTKSGSRYFLGEEDKSSFSGGLFGFIGGSGIGAAPAPTSIVVPASSSSNKAAELAANREKKADVTAAERKRIAEEAAAAAREAKAKAMRNAEENRRAAAVAKETATKREAEARREADKRTAEEAKSRREAQEEERRLNAEKRKQIEFERYQKQLEIDRQKEQQVSKPKQIQKQEQKSPRPSDPRPTFSLFRFGEQKEESTSPKTVVAALPTKPIVPTAPRGVPTINKWKLNSDNTISGFISGSSNFIDGEPVTTSPITGSATSGSVVQTKSRSSYFLGEPASSGGVFGFFGGLNVGSPTGAIAVPKQSTEAAEARKQSAEAAKGAQLKASKNDEKYRRQFAEARELEEKKRVEQEKSSQARKRAEEERNLAIEARKQVADAAAEASAKRKAEIEARKRADQVRKQTAETQKRAAAAAEKKREKEDRRRAEQEKAANQALARKQAEEERKQATEAKKRAAAAAAEQRRLEQEQKKQKLDAMKKTEQVEAAKLRQIEEKKRQAKQAVSKSPRGVTINLFDFGASKTPTLSTTGSSSAPRGIPVISKWKQVRDGSITGVISGSEKFSDGDPVTTSPIRGNAMGGTVVTTESGSKYFLEGGNASLKVVANTNAAGYVRGEAVTAARVTVVSAQKLATDKAARLKQEKEATAAAAAEKLKRDGEVKAKQAAKAVKQAKKSTTISLFGRGGNNADTVSIPPPKQQSSPAKPTVPSGVPTISSWKLTGDGSISGRISGSPSFRDGEQVTTSQIVQGRIESGSVVKTGSGSRYFLA